jgi:hypothetical protein
MNKKRSLCKFEKKFMEATIKMNVEDLSQEFIDKLKKLFPGLELEIRLKPSVDETDFILNNPAFAEELKRRIKNVENNTENLITINPEDLV